MVAATATAGGRGSMGRSLRSLPLRSLTQLVSAIFRHAYDLWPPSSLHVHGGEGAGGAAGGKGKGRRLDLRHLVCTLSILESGDGLEIESRPLLEQTALRLLTRWFDLFDTKGEQLLSVDHASHIVMATAVTDEERTQTGQLFRTLLLHDAHERGLSAMYRRVHKRVFVHVLTVRPERRADDGTTGQHMAREFDTVAPNLAELVGVQMGRRIAECRRAERGSSSSSLAFGHDDGDVVASSAAPEERQQGQAQEQGQTRTQGQAQERSVLQDFAECKGSGHGHGHSGRGELYEYEDEDEIAEEILRQIAADREREATEQRQVAAEEVRRLEAERAKRKAEAKEEKRRREIGAPAEFEALLSLGELIVEQDAQEDSTLLENY